MNIIAKHLWEIKNCPEWTDDVATAVAFVGDSIAGMSTDAQDAAPAKLTPSQRADLLKIRDKMVKATVANSNASHGKY